MLRIVTDSAADVPVAWQKEFDIQVMPAIIMFGEKMYLPGVDLDAENFYRNVDQTRQIPKTLPPTPTQVIEFFRKIAARGDTILSIHITGQLSKTLASVEAAANELKSEFNVIPIDSLNATAGIGMICRQARLLERAGKNLDEIVKGIGEFRSKVGVVLTLDTLEYARLSGRMGRVQGALVTMLNVKPILILKNGILEVAERVRSREDAIDRTLELVKVRVGAGLVDIVVVHARDPKAGQLLLERAGRLYHTRELILNDLSLSVAANVGPGTLGIAYCPVE